MKSEWNLISEDGKTTFFATPQLLIENILVAEKLIVRVNMDGIELKHASFNIKGLKALFDQYKIDPDEF